jgi:hypothetical protein
MNLIEKNKKFNKRWNIQSEGRGGFTVFRKRALVALEDIDDKLFKTSVEEFCQFFGIEKEYGCVHKAFAKEYEEVNFYRKLEILFSLSFYWICDEDDDPDEPSIDGGNIVFGKIIRAIEFSDVNLAAKKSKEGEIVFYPDGEKILDEELVDNALDSLDEKSNQHFIEALGFYQDKKCVKSAESLRRTIEEFLRYKLKNKKGLKDNALEVGKKLKDGSTSTRIRNIISQIFGYLDQYFNDECKHNDGDIDEPENEFLIYQVALLMRYVEKVIK